VLIKLYRLHSSIDTTVAQWNALHLDIKKIYGILNSLQLETQTMMIIKPHCVRKKDYSTLNITSSNTDQFSKLFNRHIKWDMCSKVNNYENLKAMLHGGAEESKCKTKKSEMKSSNVLSDSWGGADVTSLAAFQAVYHTTLSRVGKTCDTFITNRYTHAATSKPFSL